MSDIVEGSLDPLLRENNQSARNASNAKVMQTSKRKRKLFVHHLLPFFTFFAFFYCLIECKWVKAVLLVDILTCHWKLQFLCAPLMNYLK